MVLSLVHDCDLMNESNLIEDFDIFMGESTIIGPNVKVDLHTGSAYVLSREDFVEGKMIFHFLLFCSVTKLITTFAVPWQQLWTCLPLAFSTNIADT